MLLEQERQHEMAKMQPRSMPTVTPIRGEFKRVLNNTKCYIMNLKYIFLISFFLLKRHILGVFCLIIILCVLGPLPPGVSMLPVQKHRVPPPPGEDNREVNHHSFPYVALLRLLRKLFRSFF